MKFFINGVFVLFAVMVFASTSYAVELHANCPGDGTVYVHVIFTADELGDGWQGVVIERRVVGDCDTGIVLTEEPLPLLDGYDVGDYELEYPVPSPETAYRYTAMGVDASGNLVEMSGSEYYPTWFAVEACTDDALMMRGTLNDIGRHGTLGIELCSMSCWDVCAAEATVGVINLDPADYESLIGTETVVNVYGVWDSLTPEFSWGCMNAVRIEAVGDCSGVVPVTQTGWGSLKSDYR